MILLKGIYSLSISYLPVYQFLTGLYLLCYIIYVNTTYVDITLYNNQALYVVRLLLSSFMGRHLTLESYQNLPVTNINELGQILKYLKICTLKQSFFGLLRVSLKDGFTSQRAFQMEWQVQASALVGTVGEGTIGRPSRKSLK